MPMYLDENNQSVMLSKRLHDFIPKQRNYEENQLLDIRGNLQHFPVYVENIPFWDILGVNITLNSIRRNAWNFRLSCKRHESSLILKLFDPKTNVCLRFKSKDKNLWKYQLCHTIFELANKKYFDGKAFNYGGGVKTEITNLDDYSTFDLLSIVEQRYKKENPNWAFDILSNKNIADVISLESKAKVV